MKLLLLFLTISCLLFSCNPGETPNTKNVSSPRKIQASTVKGQTPRQMLIEQLKELQRTLSSNNKTAVADLFTFPTSSTELSIYPESKAFESKISSNHDKVTRALFLQYYDEASSSMWIDQVNNLFRFIDIDSLSDKDTLEHDTYLKSEPCFYSYQISVANNIVTLTMDMRSNRTYVSKHPVEDELPENSSEICEHSLWWVFEFDGAKLHFKEISGAD
jgi:hypothetical protein